MNASHFVKRLRCRSRLPNLFLFPLSRVSEHTHYNSNGDAHGDQLPRVPKPSSRCWAVNPIKVPLPVPRLVDFNPALSRYEGGRHEHRRPVHCCDPATELIPSHRRMSVLEVSYWDREMCDQERDNEGNEEVALNWPCCRTSEP